MSVISTLGKCDKCTFNDRVFRIVIKKQSSDYKDILDYCHVCAEEYFDNIKNKVFGNGFVEEFKIYNRRDKK